MNKRRQGFRLCLLGWGVLATAALIAAAQKNVIANSSFEDIENGLPRGWKPEVWQPAADLGTDSIAHSGKQSVRISSLAGGDASWAFVVPVHPFSRYRLSGWIRTANVQSLGGKGALLNLHNLQPLQTRALSGTHEWTRVELVFESQANDAVQVNCLLGGWGRVKGSAWFDDIELELLSSRRMKPEVSIDAGKRLPAISNYIYGQFIEHLGRCIYGGIWAEMLEDRKFYFPVGAKESPWKPLGEPANVRMNPILPLAGVPAPEIRLPGNGAAGGIVQQGLALIQSRGYSGRIVLAGDPGAVPVRVSLVWGPQKEQRQTCLVSEISGEYRAYPLRFWAGDNCTNGELEIASSGSESFRVATVSLMPADNVGGFRSDVLKLLRELNAPVYRWPGGNFASGYNWKEGIGERDRRPPRKNPAWQGIEHNDVGIHEFMDFCRLLGAEPYITVNSGQGSEKLAADMVEYVNGAPDSAMGQLRAQNGHPQPWGCRFWSIGNEMYGDWQLGHMPLQDYARKHNRFAAAMRAVDPAIRLVAVGALGRWDEGMLTECGNSMNYISEHFYVGEAPGLLSHVAQIPRAIRHIADAHRAYRASLPALKGKDIRIALDEWNYWYGPDLYGEIGTRYYLKDGLGVAAGIHEYYRQSDIIFMANYAQTVNVIGAIKTSQTAAEFDTTGMVLKLYRNRFGTIPVALRGAPEPLDVAAAWRANEPVLTVAVVNPTAQTQTLHLALSGVGLPRQARLWRISGSDPLAFNEPGLEPQVPIQDLGTAPFGNRLSLPPLSISLFELTIR